MAWMDGRSRAAGTGKASSCGSGGGGGVAYEARGYKQGWADGRARKTGKPTAQIIIIIFRKLSLEVAPTSLATYLSCFTKCNVLKLFLF